MALDPVAIQRVDERLRDAGLSNDARLAVLHVSAGNPFRRWPAERFAEGQPPLSRPDPRRCTWSSPPVHRKRMPPAALRSSHAGSPATTVSGSCDAASSISRSWPPWSPSAPASAAAAARCTLRRPATRESSRFSDQRSPNGRSRGATRQFPRFAPSTPVPCPAVRAINDRACRQIFLLPDRDYRGPSPHRLRVRPQRRPAGKLVSHDVVRPADPHLPPTPRARRRVCAVRNRGDDAVLIAAAQSCSGCRYCAGSFCTCRPDRGERAAVLLAAGRLRRRDAGRGRVLARPGHQPCRQRDKLFLFLLVPLVYDFARGQHGPTRC